MKLKYYKCTEVLLCLALVCLQSTHVHARTHTNITGPYFSFLLLFPHFWPKIYNQLNAYNTNLFCEVDFC
jgi:hypothetical protein